MLHIIKHRPSSQEPNWLSLINECDVILYLGEGAYHLTQTAQTTTYKINNPQYALSADAETRGLLNSTPKSITLASYADFVDLTVNHYPISYWD